MPLNKLLRLFRRPPHLRTCPNCQQPAPIQATTCPYCRQPLPHLQAVQLARSNTTIRPLSLRQKLFTRRHPLYRAFWGLFTSLLFFLCSLVVTLDAITKDFGWDTFQVIFGSLFFAAITLLMYRQLKRITSPQPEQLYPEDPTQQWLENLSNKQHKE